MKFYTTGSDKTATRQRQDSDKTLTRQRQTGRSTRGAGGERKTKQLKTTGGRRGGGAESYNV